jgi:hypothetical protein
MTAPVTKDRGRSGWDESSLGRQLPGNRQRAPATEGAHDDRRAMGRGHVKRSLVERRVMDPRVCDRR